MPATDGHPDPFLRDGSGMEVPVSRLSVSESAGWAGTALPLTACAAIWGIGDASPADVAWLTIAHDVIGTVATAWTALQLALRWRAPRVSGKTVASWPKPTLAVIYALLVLQPLLAIASSMLHGDHATLFGIPLPSVLPLDQHMARQVSRLHGGNALLLLALLTLHVGDGLRTLHRRSKQRPN